MTLRLLGKPIYARVAGTPSAVVVVLTTLQGQPSGNRRDDPSCADPAGQARVVAFGESILHYDSPARWTVGRARLSVPPVVGSHRVRAAASRLGSLQRVQEVPTGAWLSAPTAGRRLERAGERTAESDRPPGEALSAAPRNSAALRWAVGLDYPAVSGSISDSR
jgi:hypothetical protein